MFKGILVAGLVLLGAALLDQYLHPWSVCRRCHGDA